MSNLQRTSTIKNCNSWNWNSSQIIQYLYSKCHPEPARIYQSRRGFTAVELRQPRAQRRTNGELRDVWDKIISKALDQRISYVMGPGEQIVVVTVNSAYSYNQHLPITDFYSAMGWVISITEFPHHLTASTRYPYDCQNLILGIFARWCYVIANEKRLTDQMPTTVSISWIILPSGQHLVHYSPQSPKCDIMTGSATLPNKRWLAAREEARAIREGRLTEILEAFPAAPKLKNCLARLLDGLPALSYKVGPHVLVPQILDMATLRKKLKITPAFGQRWGHCAETLTLLCTYLGANIVNERLYGFCVDIKRVGTDPSVEFNDHVIEHAKVEACQNCQALVIVARANYQDLVARGKARRQHFHENMLMNFWGPTSPHRERTAPEFRNGFAIDSRIQPKILADVDHKNASLFVDLFHSDTSTSAYKGAEAEEFVSFEEKYDEEEMWW